MRTFQSVFIGSVLFVLAFAQTGCGSSWRSNLQIDTRKVARALNDPVELPRQPFNPESVPDIKPPKAIRPCCAFGMDLKAKVGPVPVIGYEDGNVVGVDDLGRHSYDKSTVGKEHNGILYSCRGGFIDIAHIRDNADRMLYLTMQIAKRLPEGFTLELPEEATLRRLIVKPVSKELLSRYGRWRLAIAMAEWVNFKLSVWHEIATWYGWQSIKGFSERLSAFSPEDLYSNVLGQKIAGGIVLDDEARSRDQFDTTMDLWIREALRRLGVLSKLESRQAMQAVDGKWWDSSKAVPEFTLVKRRNLETSSPIKPWRIDDAVPPGELDAPLKQLCAKQPPLLPLEVPERFGDHKIEELVTIEFEFSSWIPERFGLPVQKGGKFTQAQFLILIEDIRKEGQRELGPGFDQPRGSGDNGAQQPTPAPAAPPAPAVSKLTPASGSAPSAAATPGTLHEKPLAQARAAARR